uniref:Uncharacterized protein n=1 Tax=Bracon brevicornis TaxID=1563983 RepID=A0A6V7JIF3_9HYME
MGFQMLIGLRQEIVGSPIAGSCFSCLVVLSAGNAEGKIVSRFRRLKQRSWHSQRLAKRQCGFGKCLVFWENIKVDQQPFLRITRVA